MDSGGFGRIYLDYAGLCWIRLDSVRSIEVSLWESEMIVYIRGSECLKIKFRVKRWILNFWLRIWVD